jgi:cold shock CspA family protein
MSFNPEKGYGFIKCAHIPDDVYFRASCLPPEAQKMGQNQLAGKQVEVVLHFTPDAKPRADKVVMLERIDGASRNQPQAMSGASSGRKGGKSAAGPRDGSRRDDPSLPPRAPLDEEAIDAMTRFLEPFPKQANTPIIFWLGSAVFATLVAELKGTKANCSTRPHASHPMDWNHMISKSQFSLCCCIFASRAVIFAKDDKLHHHENIHCLADRRGRGPAVQA